MLTNDRISLMMDTLYGEEEENTSFHEEELKEITFLEEQMSFLDHWDIEDEFCEEENLIEKSVQKDVLNLSELANYLQLSEKDVFSLLAEIPHVELAGKLRFQLNSIKSWLHQKENKQLSNKKNNIIQFQDFLVRNVI